LIREGDILDIDVEARTVNVELTDEELTERRAAWQPPQPHYISGVFAKYARLAAQADDGAVTNSKTGLVRA
jgi:dihydroxy-acid dehydratase